MKVHILCDFSILKDGGLFLLKVNNMHDDDDEMCAPATHIS